MKSIQSMSLSIQIDDQEYGSTIELEDLHLSETLSSRDLQKILEKTGMRMATDLSKKIITDLLPKVQT